MSNYDPRTPIVKATESEMDDVSGHIKHMRGPEQEPVEKRLSVSGDEQGEEPGVEGIAAS